MKTLLLVLLSALLCHPALGDDRERLAELFSQTNAGGTVTIPPGDYSLDGAQPIPLVSGLTVQAYGARFHLPQKLGDKARAVLFFGENIRDLR